MCNSLYWSDEYLFTDATQNLGCDLFVGLEQIYRYMMKSWHVVVFTQALIKLKGLISLTSEGKCISRLRAGVDNL